MFEKERELVTEQFLKRKDVYNLCIGGEGGNKNGAGISGAQAIKKRYETDLEFRKKDLN